MYFPSFLEAILACKTPKKTASSRLEWKKLGRGVSLVYYQQALQGKKLDLRRSEREDTMYNPYSLQMGTGQD